VHDKILKKKLQYMLSGTVCDVFKGGTHHGALELSLRFSKLRTSYRGGDSTSRDYWLFLLDKTLTLKGGEPWGQPSWPVSVCLATP
jgi:hypothetical protein